jgi:flavin reductase (DIM6/NTAB) family NADH-FMN oxidoreductase RutF
VENLKLALRRLAKAVAVISSANDDGRYAMSATAVSELSMDPPSMLVCVNQSASLYPVLAGGADFAINILHHSHVEIALRCAGKAKGEARFADAEWVATDLAVPRLADAQASIVCRNVRQVDHGTHGIFIGNVVEVHLSGSPEPLVYLDGRFTRAQLEKVDD